MLRYVGPTNPSPADTSLATIGDAKVLTYPFSKVESVAFDSNLTLNWDNVATKRITLTGNCTIDFTGGVDDQRVILELTQDATGSRLVTWGSSIRFSGDIPSVTLSVTAGKIDRLAFTRHAPTGRYDLITYARGF